MHSVLPLLIVFAFGLVATPAFGISCPPECVTIVETAPPPRELPAPLPNFFGASIVVAGIRGLASLPLGRPGVEGPRPVGTEVSFAYQNSGHQRLGQQTGARFMSIVSLMEAVPGYAQLQGTPVGDLFAAMFELGKGLFNDQHFGLASRVYAVSDKLAVLVKGLSKADRVRIERNIAYQQVVAGLAWLRVQVSVMNGDIVSTGAINDSVVEDVLREEDQPKAKPTAKPKRSRKAESRS